jgi:hypothetical protein
MARCETCGNNHDKACEISMAGPLYTFASFECATQALAPTREHCGCRIIGYGIEAHAARGSRRCRIGYSRERRGP